MTDSKAKGLKDQAKYDEAKEKGKAAEMRVGSILRGGFAYKGQFYFYGPRLQIVPLNNTLVFHDELLF